LLGRLRRPDRHAAAAVEVPLETRARPMGAISKQRQRLGAASGARDGLVWRSARQGDCNRRHLRLCSNA
jgi:hypothetical protein